MILFTSFVLDPVQKNLLATSLQPIKYSNKMDGITRVSFEIIVWFAVDARK